tara:strand:- start:131 stop:1321 length:1191 start_codon:yes stop_codon:yes gene_type:complete
MVFTGKIFIVMHHSSQGIYKRNILSKSLNVEVFKSTVGILLIFFFLVVSSRFVGYFEQASEGLIDPNLIFKVVFLRFPDFITLLLPLSFFLGIVITISRLYADREIYGYFSGGLSEKDLIKFLFPQSLIFFLITLSLSIYIAPYTKELSKEILTLDTLKEQFESIKSKEIFSLKNEDGFIYADKNENNSFENVAIYLSNESYSSFIVADRLDYDDSDSEINLNFQNGILYQDIFTSESSVVSYFGQLKIPVINDNKPVSGLSFTKLFDFSTKSSKSETQWNISIPITIFILLILGVTLSKVGPRQGRLSVLLPAIFVYILYLSLLILARETYSENSFNAQNYIWYVHTIFFGISLMTLFRTHLSQTLRPNIILLSNNFVRLLLFGLISLIFFWVLG